jgi:radical SAM superfamily enzyme
MALSDQALKALTEVGCRQINMGIEKAQFAALQKLRKRLSPQTAREACDRLSNSDLRVAGTFIIGGPDETPEDVEATIDFALSLPLNFAHFNPMAVYPGTLLFEQMFNRDTDWLALCLDEDVAPCGDILWRSEEMPLSRILESVEQAYRRFYTTERLGRTLERLPENEKETVQHSYDVLSNDRAQSWQSGELVKELAVSNLTC